MRGLLWVFLVFAVSLLGCGRDSLQRACLIDDDCGENQICQAGYCIDDTEEPDPCADNSCVEEGCTSNADCKEDETCDVPNGECVAFVCVTQGFDCVATECGADGCSQVSCDVAPCPPGSTSLGCECVPTVCEGPEDCDGLFCVDGVCQGCADDSWCGEDELCSDDGRCVPDLRCMGDEDCAPEERCGTNGVCVPRAQCFLDSQCRNEGEICIGGRCVLAPECTDDMDCADGFECVGGNCFEKLCRGPQDCERGEVCDGGQCVMPPVAASCFVATPSGVIADGQLVQLEAFALDQNGQGVSALFRWTSSNPAVASIDAAQRNAVGGTAAGTTTISATLATGDPIVCTPSATLTNLGPVPMGGLRVVVVENQSGAPIANAQVLIGGTVQVTDAAGVASFPIPTGSYEVTVVHPNFNILTVQDLQATDIRLPLSTRRGSGPVGGFKGKFDTSALGSTGEVTVGLAGASLAGGLLEVDLINLLGDSFASRINIPGIVNETIPLPGGIIAYGGAFGFNINVKDTYYARSSSGARMAWGLAGKIPLRELISLGQGGGQGLVLATLLPLFNRFDHGSTPFLSVERPQVVDSADINGNGDTMELVPDYTNFPTINLRPATRQTLTTDVDVSNFPVLTNGQAELAILLGGTVLDSPGLVPLGISATNDENGDGRPDMRRLSIAPPAGALTGGRYALVAIAFTTENVGLGVDGLPNDLSVSLWNGQSFPSSIRLGTFPGASTTTLDAASRQVTLNAAAGPVYRLRIVSPTVTWDVWSSGPAGTMGAFAHTITVPASPLSAIDPFQAGSIVLDAIRTNVTTNELVRANGVGLKNAGLVTTAFNRSTVR